MHGGMENAVRFPLYSGWWEHVNEKFINQTNENKFTKTNLIMFQWHGEKKCFEVSWDESIDLFHCVESKIGGLHLLLSQCRLFSVWIGKVFRGSAADNAKVKRTETRSLLPNLFI